MANIKSQIKRNKQNEKRRLRNRVFRGAARTAIKTAHVAMEPSADAKVEVTTAIRALDKAAIMGAIHPKNAARRKSRLMKAANKAAVMPAVEATEKKKSTGKK